MADVESTTRPLTREIRADSPLPEHPRGQRIGRYLLLEPLGRGGMGAVFRAYDPTLDRSVALKILSQGAHDSEGRDRLLREAQAMARVAHPSIVKVHDAGVQGDHLFLAMDLVEGTTLRSWLAAAPGQSEILRVFMAAGEALAAAHDAGLVHRDFKPANVLMDRAGAPFVTDFGLARLSTPSGRAEVSPPVGSGAASSDPDHSLLGVEITRAGTVVGTPAYMSPEQHRGEHADARSDQFSFCVALFEALCGRRPFVGDGPSELLANIVRGRIARDPSSRRIPRWLEPILERGLAPEPWQRFPSMHALLSALVRRRSAAAWLRGTGVVLVGLVGLVGAQWGLVAYETETSCGAAPRGVDALEQLPAGPDGATRPEDAAGARLDRFRAQWRHAATQACVEHRITKLRSAAEAQAAVDCLDEQRLGVSALIDQLNGASAEQVLLATTRLPRPDLCLDRGQVVAAAPEPDVRSALAQSWAASARDQPARAREILEQLVAGEPSSVRGPGLGRAWLALARATLVDDPSMAAVHATRAIDIAEASGLDGIVAAAWLERVRAERLVPAPEPRLARTLAFARAAQARAGDEPIARAELSLVESQLALDAGRADQALAHARAAWGVVAGDREADELRLDALEAAAASASAAGLEREAAGWWLEAWARGRARLGAEHPRVARARERMREAVARTGGGGDARD